MTEPLPFRLFRNPRQGVPGVVVLPQGGFRRAAAEIRAWPGYAPTPLLPLAEVAAAAGVASVHGKDCRGRPGQGGTWAKGGAYAVARLLMAELARAGVTAGTAALMRGEHAAEAGAVTLACVADGPFAPAIAWAAARCGAACVVFVPAGASKESREAFAGFGATLRDVPGQAGAALCHAVAEAGREGWLLLSDMSWSGYTEVPRDVMQGDRLAVEEALEEMQEAPTHVFARGGASGVAAAASVQLRQRFGTAPRLVVVEPEHDARLLNTALAGTAATLPEASVDGPADGAPGLLAWQELERAAFAFMALPPAAILRARNVMDQPPMALETGLAGLLAAGTDAQARDALALEATSRILVLGD
jgi:diaminopropionate ammonia-lyase